MFINFSIVFNYFLIICYQVYHVYYLQIYYLQIYYLILLFDFLLLFNDIYNKNYYNNYLLLFLFHRLIEYNPKNPIFFNFLLIPLINHQIN